MAARTHEKQTVIVATKKKEESKKGHQLPPVVLTRQPSGDSSTELDGDLFRSMDQETMYRLLRKDSWNRKRQNQLVTGGTRKNNRETYNTSKNPQLLQKLRPRVKSDIAGSSSVGSFSNSNIFLRQISTMSLASKSSLGSFASISSNKATKQEDLEGALAMKVLHEIDKALRQNGIKTNDLVQLFPEFKETARGAAAQRGGGGALPRARTRGPPGRRPAAAAAEKGGGGSGGGG
eukprot:CAMPEP_0206401160 /NCGR_PEP_ID=MMETSP0294-20121207/26073_1 /ASSEMBLY_ACC=CAM_ASM_000327 /TAXON_ID=39354 /ORGANISM="Heterosigma akashiwo, Strain CCMP2393" /LENGTH=233 /DNA_ID=CAMNT_0053857745 /DNA_START=17 /DNA_END=714 /DNA_ORIENTATION=+